MTLKQLSAVNWVLFVRNLEILLLMKFRKIPDIWDPV